MMRRLRHRWSIAALVLVSACATLQQIAALSRVAFALGGVSNASLAGVPLTRIASYRDLSVTDIGRIGIALARNDLPLEFRLNVRAANPAENRTTATMVRLPWTLLLDGTETISGVLDSSVALPAGATVLIPLQMRVNLKQFFGGSAESLVNLAASFAGVSADPTRVTLRATPTISTPIGPITYPSPITIVSASVGGKSSP